MLKFLFPKAYFSTVSQIKPEWLKEKGIKGIILDIDNTIVPWDSNMISQQVSDTLKTLRDNGFKIGIVSNGRTRRVKTLIEPFGFPAIPKAVKPRRRAFLEIMSVIGTTPQDTAVVGDQIFTDILGGNRLGAYTILVKPISKAEFIGTKMVRILEKGILYYLRKKGFFEER